MQAVAHSTLAREAQRQVAAAPADQPNEAAAARVAAYQLPPSKQAKSPAFAEADLVASYAALHETTGLGLNYNPSPNVSNVEMQERWAQKLAEPGGYASVDRSDHAHPQARRGAASRAHPGPFQDPRAAGPAGARRPFGAGHHGARRGGSAPGAAFGDRRFGSGSAPASGFGDADAGGRGAHPGQGSGCARQAGSVAILIPLLPHCPGRDSRPGLFLVRPSSVSVCGLGRFLRWSGRPASVGLVREPNGPRSS